MIVQYVHIDNNKKMETHFKLFAKFSNIFGNLVFLNLT